MLYVIDSDDDEGTDIHVSNLMNDDGIDEDEKSFEDVDKLTGTEMSPHSV